MQTGKLSNKGEGHETPLGLPFGKGEKHRLPPFAKGRAGGGFCLPPFAKGRAGEGSGLMVCTHRGGMPIRRTLCRC
jgi:hypothetical protein